MTKELELPNCAYWTLAHCYCANVTFMIPNHVDLEVQVFKGSSLLVNVH